MKSFGAVSPEWLGMDQEGAGYGDDGPTVEELERAVREGRACCECQTLFVRRHNHPKTLCKTCSRLFIESRGYLMAIHREQNAEAHARRNRKRNGP